MKAEVALDGGRIPRRIGIQFMTTGNNQFFDTLASSYDKPRTVDRANAVAEEIRRQLPIRSDMTALDYGAGTGLMAFALKPFVKSIIAVDYSQGMIEALQQKIDEFSVEGVTPVLGDINTGQLDGMRFDLVYSSMTMHHIPNVAEVLSKFYDLIEPGGFIAIADLDAEDGSFHGDHTEVHHHGFDREEMVRLLRQVGFIDVRSSTAHTMTKEIENGETRDFPVFLVVGRKG
ncbi:MAG: class I SAM-dependent DNA methyltransferase [Armatimonadota bacterium]|jgi:ubiquinone/menaquinone biosynthesis C-methylase UbiE